MMSKQEALEVLKETYNDNSDLTTITDAVITLLLNGWQLAEVGGYSDETFLVFIRNTPDLAIQMYVKDGVVSYIAHSQRLGKYKTTLTWHSI